MRLIYLTITSIFAFLTSYNAIATQNTYTFNNTLNALESGQNPLQSVSNASGSPYQTGSFGSFVSTTISASVCPNTPTTTGYSFPLYSGLKMPNNSPTIATGTYTISVIAKFNPLGGSYTRLIDFSNSTSDNGIYTVNGQINLFPNATAPGVYITDNQYFFITFSRDANTKIVEVYVGTTLVDSYHDTGDIYASTQDIIFFMDNTTGSAAISEASPGVIAYMVVKSTTSTSSDISTLQTQACASIAPSTYTIGGTVTGLATGQSLILQNNGSDNLTTNANGAFTFSTAISSGSSYAVTVLTQPTGQSCAVSNGTGTANANVTSVIVTCTDAASIPTLSEWTQIVLAFMAFGLVFWYQKRESV